MRVILVKIGQTHVEWQDPMNAAWRAWTCTRLLRDEEFRMETVYLAAVHRQQIIAVYCIRAVAQDHIETNRVKFALSECENQEHAIGLLGAQCTAAGFDLNFGRPFAYVEIPNGLCNCENRVELLQRDAFMSPDE